MCYQKIKTIITIFLLGSIKVMKDGEYKVHIVASVLKKYLGDLPKSVIPPENYDQFIAVGGCKIFIYFFFQIFSFI